MDVISEFTKQVNDLVDDYCDDETRQPPLFPQREQTA